MKLNNAFLSKTFNRPYAFHSLFFSLYFILFLISHNVEQIFSVTTLSEILLVVFAALFISFICLLVFSIIFRNIRKSGLFVTIFISLFFLFGHVGILLSNVNILGVDFGYDVTRIRIYLWIIIVSFFLLFFIKKEFVLITKFLNLFSIVLLSMVTINISIYKFNDYKFEKNTKPKSSETKQFKSTNIISKYKPDIYYIILDGYPHNTTLEGFYNFNNNAFLDSLKNKGFYIVNRARSNYALTGFSLASALRMNYVNDVAKNYINISNNSSSLFEFIKNNEVMKFLKQKGYKTIHIDGDSTATRRNEYADLEITCGFSSEFRMLLVRSTVLDFYEKRGKINLVSKDSAKGILCAFNQLSEIPKIDGPTFVFAHIMAPHPPFWFTKNGELRKNVEMSLHFGNTWKDKEHFVENLQFTNNKALELVDNILSRSKEPPVIILQGDHGSGSLEEWDKPSKRFLQERMRILNAIYLPKNIKSNLYDSLTPVNTFRLIFNSVFSEKFEILEDKSYFSNYDFRFVLQDVTINVEF